MPHPHPYPCWSLRNPWHIHARYNCIGFQFCIWLAVRLRASRDTSCVCQRLCTADSWQAIGVLISQRSGLRWRTLQPPALQGAVQGACCPECGGEVWQAAVPGAVQVLCRFGGCCEGCSLSRTTAALSTKPFPFPKMQKKTIIFLHVTKKL